MISAAEVPVTHRDSLDGGDPTEDAKNQSKTLEPAGDQQNDDNEQHCLKSFGQASEIIKAFTSFAGVSYRILVSKNSHR